MVVVALLLLLILISLSLWQRVRLSREAVAGVEVKSSPLTQAVQELLATAGGVYLAIVALVSFLKLDMPDKISLMKIAIDPLAGAAIVLAIVQPFFTRLFIKIKHR